MKKNMNDNRSMKETVSRILAVIFATVLLGMLFVYPAAAEEDYLSDIFTDPLEEIVYEEEPPAVITEEGPAAIVEEEPAEITGEELPGLSEEGLVEVFEEEFVEVPAEEMVDYPIDESAEDMIEALPEYPVQSEEPIISETMPAEQEEISAAMELQVLLEEVITEQETEELASQLDTVRQLQYGDTGTDVWLMQKKLATLGYLSASAIDGIYSVATQKSVKLFQMYHGLSMTGVADLVTLDTLSRSSLSFYGQTIGSYGNAVYGMQSLLYKMGYLDFEPDGDYGPRTAQCVRDFQKAYGLYVDGEAGPITLDALVGAQVEQTTGTGAVSLGATGKAVTVIQKVLIYLGYLSSEADGYYGQTTQAAVITFQAANGIYNPTGSVDLETWELMKNAESFTKFQAGSKGIDVYVMQKKLISLGYLPAGSANGSFNSATVSALKRFQFYNGIWVNGVANIKTLIALYCCTTSPYSLSIGAYDIPTYMLQWFLWYYGYLDIAPDGDYGPYTARAVEQFQIANGLYVDGIAGPYTIDVLLASPKSYAAYRDNIVVEYGGTYVITVGNTRGTLEVADSSVYSGANVQLNAFQDYGCQKWVMQNAGYGYYYIRNLRSWKVLEVVNGNVQQSEYSGSAAQMWKIVKAENGGYYIINSNGMYLTGNSGNAAVSTGGTGGYQNWYMQEVDPGTALDFRTDGTQYLGIRTFNINQGNVTETSGYYKIETDIDLPSGGYYLSGGDNYSIGLKVMYVNSFLASAGYLSWDYYNYNRYDSNTVWAVRQFQADYGLSVDGVVGLQDWLYMGYSEYDWYNLGAYTTGLKVYAYGSSRETYVNAMLNTAYEYMAAGTRYADGASGVPGTYVDCSGLIYQCLYAAGINPDTNIIDHARVVYEYTSAYLGSDWQMGVAVSNAQPGDLIFYGNSSINHVAIYAGNGMIYDSWPGIGVSYRSMYSGGNILKIVRVF